MVRANDRPIYSMYHASKPPDLKKQGTDDSMFQLDVLEHLDASAGPTVDRGSGTAYSTRSAPHLKLETGKFPFRCNNHRDAQA